MINLLGLVYQPSASTKIEGSYRYKFKRLSLVHKVMDSNTTELGPLAFKISIETHPMDDATGLPRREWLGSVCADFARGYSLKLRIQLKELRND